MDIKYLQAFLSQNTVEIFMYASYLLPVFLLFSGRKHTKDILIFIVCFISFLIPELYETVTLYWVFRLAYLFFKADFKQLSQMPLSSNSVVAYVQSAPGFQLGMLGLIWLKRFLKFYVLCWVVGLSGLGFVYLLGFYWTMN